MKCKLFIPYDGVDFSNFEENDIYIKEGSYEEALNAELAKGNDAFNALFGDGIVTNFQSNNSQDNIKAKIHYISCDAEIYNEEMKDETPMTLIRYAVDKEPTIMLIKFDFYSMGEDFETDLRMWIDNHNNINRQDFSDEWKFKNEPTRSFKLLFKNLQNQDTYLELENCKILEPYSNSSYLILIERVNFSEDIN